MYLCVGMELLRWLLSKSSSHWTGLRRQQSVARKYVLQFLNDSVHQFRPGGPVALVSGGEESPMVVKSSILRLPNV